jgi:Bifunctional DNA primase/polymerase, N-terminal
MKKPAGGPGWQQRITSNATEIEHWQGNYNIGIMGGSPLPDGRRLLIVDIDVKNDSGGARSMAILQETYGPLPNTATSVIPSGGKHLYFQVPAHTRLSGIRDLFKKIDLCGLDLIGEGLFAVPRLPPYLRGNIVGRFRPQMGSPQPHPGWITC